MDIIQQLAAQVGIHPEQAEKAAGAVASLIQENASKIDFQQLLGAVPEISGWLHKAKAAGVTGPAAAGAAAVGGDDEGGFLGQMGGLLGELTGGGGLGALLGALGKAGLNAETAAKFVPALLGLLRTKAGHELIAKLASSMPFLHELLEGAGDAGGAGSENGESDGGLGALGGVLGKMFS